MTDYPKTHYAYTDAGEIAYQVAGEGAFDLIFIPSWDSNIEVIWEEPALRRFLERLASFSRLICFDKRGTGVSAPVLPTAVPTLEEWSDDVGVVLDAVGVDRAAVFGHAEGGHMATFFAATHPERVSALILADTCARFIRAADYPCGLPEDIVERFLGNFRAWWGTERHAVMTAPSLRDDARFRHWYARLQRLAMTPTLAATSYGGFAIRNDLRSILPTIRVPTLVMHRRDNRHMRSCHGRYLAEHIEHASYLEVEGEDHLYWVGAVDTMLDATEEFLTGRRQEVSADRVLATVLFTDIVDSTSHAAAMGDERWHHLLDEHDAMTSQQVTAFRGRIIKTTGDGMLATFDGPARAIRCALEICDAARPLGIEIRAGLHSGEIELRDGDVGGIAVHIGQRVSALAAPHEVLVSRTVVDLVVGSGMEFEDRGEHELKGVPGAWKLFAVAS